MTRNERHRRALERMHLPQANEKQYVEGLRVRLMPATAKDLRIPEACSVARLELDEDDSCYSKASFYGYLVLGFTRKLDLYYQYSRWNDEGQLRQDDVELLDAKEWAEWIEGMQVRIPEREGVRLGIPLDDRLTTLQVDPRDDGHHLAVFGKSVKIVFSDCLSVVDHSCTGLTGNLDLGQLEFLPAGNAGAAE